MMNKGSLTNIHTCSDRWANDKANSPESAEHGEQTH